MEDGGDGGFNIKSHNKKNSTKHILSVRTEKHLQKKAQKNTQNAKKAEKK